jgi:hypothetical protein
MKLVYFCLVVASLASEAWAQGQIGFRNIVRGLIDAPVFDTDCETRLRGNAYLSQIYVGLRADSLQAAASAVPFLSTGVGGYMEQATGAVVDGAGDGTIVFVQLRAWEAAAGPSYEAAVSSGGKHGFSNITTVQASTPPGPIPWAVGIESYCLIPEPPAFSLWGCAAAVAGGLLAARRRAG